MKTYSELTSLSDFKERLDYLRLDGKVGEDTFGFERYLNQTFYNTEEWKSVRRQVIVRDQGNDLGVDGFDISGRVIVHHINPISKSMILNRDPLILDPENLISVSRQTHDAIHYGGDPYRQLEPTIRKPNDTKLW